MLKKYSYHRSVGLLVLLMMYLSETRAMKTARLSFHITDRNRCLTSGYVIHRVLSVPIGSCVEQCFARTGKCMAVNYRKRFNLCELLNTDTGEMEENNSKSGACEFVSMTDIYMNELAEMCQCNENAGETCDLKTSTCIFTECPILTLSNGMINGNMFEVGSVLKYHCNPNYVEVNNITTSTCLVSGQWSYQPECTVDCGPPPDVTNANVLPGSTLLDDSRTYQCNTGFAPDPNGGTMETTCKSTGDWSHTRFTCLIDCGIPPVVGNANVLPGSTLQHNIRTYQCNTGFAPDPDSGAMETTCKSTGDWSPILFTCIVDCGLPPDEKNANIVPGSTLLGDSRTYQCNTGFAPDHESGTMETTCKITGDWSSTLFTCIVDCGIPPVVSNAQVLSGTTLLDDSRTYQCNTGFAPGPNGGTMDTTCKDTGDWSLTHFTCIVDCGTPPVVMNAQVLSGTTLLDDSQTYQCNTGFAPDPNGGTMDTKCTDTGDWSNTILSCIVDCGTPPVVSNAQVLSGTTLLGDSRTYQCNTGFAPDPNGGTMETKCEDTGDWSLTHFTCIVDCGIPPAVMNAQVLSGSTLLGDSRTYQCNTGFAPDPATIGTMDTTCKSTGDWSNTIFTCIVDCGTPWIIANTVISAGTTIEGSVRTYDCGNGHLSNGLSSTITCMSSGYWSYTSFACQATSIGYYCSSSDDCIGTGAVCISLVCFCGPLYRYNATTRDCVQVCTTFTDQFESIANTNINGFNEFGNIDYITESACIEECKANSECHSADYFSGPGARCYLSKVTYYMALDAFSGTIVINDSTVFSRICT